MDTFSKQVDKDAYRFSRYAGFDRFASYHVQLQEVVQSNPSSVLEIGVGDQVVARYIKNNTTIAYTSCDIADDVGADIQASVTSLPFDDKAFDLVCAFEVLEHLPFEQFEVALGEMARVARKRVLISVPHFGPPMKVLCKLPLLPEIRFALKIPFPLRHEFNGQHYWEIGKRGYSVRRVRTSMRRFFKIERDFVPFHNQYHHFFVLTPHSV